MEMMHQISILRFLFVFISLILYNHVAFAVPIVDTTSLQPPTTQVSSRHLATSTPTLHMEQTTGARKASRTNDSQRQDRANTGKGGENLRVNPPTTLSLPLTNGVEMETEKVPGPSTGDDSVQITDEVGHDITSENISVPHEENHDGDHADKPQNGTHLDSLLKKTEELQKNNSSVDLKIVSQDVDSLSAKSESIETETSQEENVVKSSKLIGLETKNNEASFPIDEVANLEESTTNDHEIVNKDIESRVTSKDEVEENDDNEKYISNDAFVSIAVKNESQRSEESSSSYGAQIARIGQLERMKANLKQALKVHQLENKQALQDLRRSKLVKRSIESDQVNLHAYREHAQEELTHIHDQIPKFESTMKVLQSQVREAIKEMERLRTRKFWLNQRLRSLKDDLRERGLGRWVEERMKENMNEVVADALIEGTATMIEPMMDGIEIVREAEEELEDIVRNELRERVAIVDRPFYSGFISYMVLLLPVVLITSILVRVRRRVVKVGRDDLMFVGNMYFDLLCMGCFCASCVGKVDVLLTVREMNKRIFDAVMVVHGGLYMCYILVHIIEMLISRTHASALHTILLSGIGMHMFVHSWQHAIHHEDPHVDVYGYMIYMIILTFILYELSMKRMKNDDTSKVLRLNNTSISMEVDEKWYNKGNNNGSLRYNRNETSDVDYNEYEYGRRGYTSKQRLNGRKERHDKNGSNGLGNVTVSLASTDSMAARII